MRTEDGSIINRCLNGEPEAFGLLVDKYKTGIYAFVYAKLRNFHDAQDMTQEVFIQAYRDLRSLRNWDSFVFWLYRIASARCSKWQRAKSRHPDEFIDDQDPHVLEAPSINSYRENQIYDWLQESLDSLPEAYREVLMLHYFGGMKTEEIARALGLSPTSIRMRLSRARSQLREDMLAMMRGVFEQQRLPVSFTFRIVEEIKRIKIQPISTIKGLPWGLSFVAGLIIVIMSLNPNLSQMLTLDTPTGFPLPVETAVPRFGEYPVDTVQLSQLPAISNEMGKGKGGDMQNAFFLAPQGEGGIWRKKSDISIGRCFLGTSAVDGKIYAIGGLSENFDFVPTVEVYDPKRDNWARKADMPTPRRIDNSVCVVNGKIYAIGSGGQSFFAESNLSATSNEEYDPAKDIWTKKANMPTARFALCTAVVNNKIYAIGGTLDFNNSFSAIEEYDPLTDTWTKIKDMPTPRLCPCAVQINGKIYVIGGYSGFNKGIVYKTVEEYDPLTNRWSRKSDMLIGRFSFGASVSNGKIFVCGGVIEGETGSGVADLTVEEYDPIKDIWTQRADMPTKKAGLSASTVNGKIYTIGGGPVSGTSIIATPTVEEYTPDDLLTVVSPKGKLPTTWGEAKK